MSNKSDTISLNPIAPHTESSSKASIPRWSAPILGLFAWLVAIPIGHGAVPWAISLLTVRYGWSESHPRSLNLIGLVPVAIGSVILIWVAILGFVHIQELPERVKLDWSPKILLAGGPYRFTRNPMYIAELSLWFGWAIFYGSTVVLIASVILSVAVNFIVQREERDLEARFGERYLEYKSRVPRWFR